MAAEAGDIWTNMPPQWGPLPHQHRGFAHTRHIRPRFPGLIYLSMLSYMRESERPNNVREPMLNTFFSDILLPHEIAHQWWGNSLLPMITGVNG